MNGDLFSQYPERPGWKARETSALAAERVAQKAPVLRARCLREIAAAPVGLTANEIAEKLDWDITSVRPRVTELVRLGKVRARQTEPKRRPTPSGCSAIIWEAVPEAGQMAAAA